MSVREGKRTARMKTAAPSQKVFAGMLAGALSAVIVWALGAVWKVAVPPEIAQAFTVILTLIVSWYTPPSDDEVIISREE
jgi:hypothetical protein